MKKLIFIFYLFLFTQCFVLTQKNKKQSQLGNRKEFIMTQDEAEEKDNAQIQQYLNEMRKFDVQVELEKDNIDNLEGKNIDMAKGFLLDRMDQIYENFIQPSRWYF